MTTASPSKVEHEITMPILNPDSSGSSRTFRFAGKIDEMDLQEGRIIDYKSTKDPLRFVAEKTIGFQPDLYALAARECGICVQEIEYRLVSVPGIICTKGKPDNGSLDAYEGRCFQWCCDPGHPRRLWPHPIPINPARLATARAYAWDCAKRILDSRKHHRWLPNEHGCWTWNKACPFLPLCEQLAGGGDPQWIIEERYETKPKNHTELETEEDGKTILTYSSMSTLSLCEQKYYWSYERGLRRKQDYDVAPWLGSAMHAGIAAFATGGIEAAYAAIDAWREANPAFGEAIDKVEENVRKARAMCRAAMERWG